MATMHPLSGFIPSYNEIEVRRVFGNINREVTTRNGKDLFLHRPSELQLQVIEALAADTIIVYDFSNFGPYKKYRYYQVKAPCWVDFDPALSRAYPQLDPDIRRAHFRFSKIDFIIGNIDFKPARLFLETLSLKHQECLSSNQSIKFVFLHNLEQFTWEWTSLFFKRPIQRWAAFLEGLPGFTYQYEARYDPAFLKDCNDFLVAAQRWYSLACNMRRQWHAEYMGEQARVVQDSIIEAFERAYTGSMPPKNICVLCEVDEKGRCGVHARWEEEAVTEWISEGQWYRPKSYKTSS